MTTNLIMNSPTIKIQGLIYFVITNQKKFFFIRYQKKNQIFKYLYFDFTITIKSIKMISFRRFIVN